MTTHEPQMLCDLYITPDERRLLARVAHGRGVGRDYLALRETREAWPAHARPIARWLGKGELAAPTPVARTARPARKARAAPQARQCHACIYLARQPLPAMPDGAVRFVCARSVWTRPLSERSIHTSLRLRTLSRACPHFLASPRPERPVLRHCRACAHLQATDTVDERYICGRRVWTNPMKPLSIANSRRLEQLSATCPHFAPTTGRWLPRSKKRPWI